MSGAKMEVRAEDMPKDWPCGRCAKKRCNIPCVAMRIFYADFMHKCRAAARIETEEREEIYRKYVDAQMQTETEAERNEARRTAAEKHEERARAIRRKMKESKIIQREIAEKIGVARRTVGYYMSAGVTEAVAERIETAIEEILRERGERKEK